MPPLNINRKNFKFQFDNQTPLCYTRSYNKGKFGENRRRKAEGPFPLETAANCGRLPATSLDWFTLEAAPRRRLVHKERGAFEKRGKKVDRDKNGA